MTAMVTVMGGDGDGNHDDGDHGSFKYSRWDGVRKLRGKVMASQVSAYG